MQSFEMSLGTNHRKVTLNSALKRLNMLSYDCCHTPITHRKRIEFSHIHLHLMKECLYFIVPCGSLKSKIRKTNYSKKNTGKIYYLQLALGLIIWTLIIN